MPRTVILGVKTSQADFVDAARSHDAEAVLVSSLYGHAGQDCEGFHDRLAEAGLDVCTYVGGNLAVGQDEFEQTRERFREMGFDRVFDAETDPQEAIAALRQDLQLTAREAERARVDS